MGWMTCVADEMNDLAEPLQKEIATVADVLLEITDDDTDSWAELEEDEAEDPGGDALFEDVLGGIDRVAVLDSTMTQAFVAKAFSLVEEPLWQGKHAALLLSARLIRAGLHEY